MGESLALIVGLSIERSTVRVTEEISMTRIVYMMHFFAFVLNLIAFICININCFFFEGSIKSLIFAASMILAHGYTMIFDLVTEH